MDLESLIKYILSQHRFLHEYRLQKLVYLSELVSQFEDYGRITDAEFKPYMYGAYSDDISDSLSDLASDEDVNTSPDMWHGELTTAYHWEGSSPPEIEEKELLDRVIEVARSKSNDELATWSKDTWLFEETDFGEAMDFSDIEKEQLIEDLKDEFPDFFEDV